MPVRPNHIVVDADDLPGLARFWTQPLDWKVLPERERDLFIRTDEQAPAGMVFMSAAPIRVTIVKRAYGSGPVTTRDAGWADCSSGSSSQLPGLRAARPGFKLERP